jgi:hypothetical protein
VNDFTPKFLAFEHQIQPERMTHSGNNGGDNVAVAG